MLALFGVALGSIDLVVLGLLFLAIQLVFPWQPWAGYVRRP